MARDRVAYIVEIAILVTGRPTNLNQIVLLKRKPIPISLQLVNGTYIIVILEPFKERSESQDSI